ncbi:MAG: 2-octaprenyl-3-methyl-6-methoxy-1,4-benzoquinol hydroxylase [Haliea sp.]|uniref:UbiH/UbiF/VisC/COQ6 family ubiquinone biosynthesis hydroxylase n=1 Tax=Haliea sp. TaxID=1932666 RepID=UPI000C37E573|nr:UbiH/UbiF/VisC/COQ6 family ubiquinone biosynthesis hydroxylase [Haliea sp.]MBM68840.1 2-octaprenyl-3-methyl-6-methoxy-1,4-benzoquinol hydroxylase [Haliea sp.]|tara:strand:+ start:28780 stop:30015 length:1236 start_codon:yes stop_codon:yes gene_type:complete
MTELPSCDVAIVGAGIAGSALAAALSGRGLQIVVIEAQGDERAVLPDALALESFDPRVVALSPRSRRLLNELGAWQAVADYRLCAYDHMTVWDAEGTGSIDFDSADVGAAALGYIVENRALVGALLGRLAACPDVRLLAPESLAGCERAADGALVLTLASGAQLRPELVVAADGAQSRLRDLLAFRTREWGYGHHAVVATVQVERPHQTTAWQRFLPSGPLAFLPLPSAPDAQYCSIVWSLDSSRVDGIQALQAGEFCAALERAFEGRLGRVLGCSRRFAFPLRQRHAVDYVQPGAALVADAAHTIHPLAGQGINLGLQDVAALAEEVLRARERGEQPGSIAVLRRYQRRRKGENLAMMAAMEGFKRLFEQPALPLRWLRNAGMRGVDRAGPLKHQLMRQAMGLTESGTLE